MCLIFLTEKTVDSMKFAMKLMLAAAMVMGALAGETTVTMESSTTLSTSDKNDVKFVLQSAAAGVAVVLASSDIAVTQDGNTVTATITTNNVAKIDEAMCAGGDVIVQGLAAVGVTVSNVQGSNCGGGLGAGVIIIIVVVVLVVLAGGIYLYKKKKAGGAPDAGMEQA